MSDENQVPSGQADSGTSPTPTPTPDLLARLDAASNRALDAAGATPTKRKPGQRGPDKQKRRPVGKGISLEDVGSSSAETLFEASETAGNPESWSSVAPGLDEETAQALADVVYELFIDARANVWRFRVLRLTGSKELADAFITPVSEKLASAMRKSAKALVVTYGAQLEYAPEITFLGAAAVIVVGDWLRFRGLSASIAQMPNQSAA